MPGMQQDGILELQRWQGDLQLGFFYFHLSLFCSQDVPKAVFMHWAEPEAGGACCSHLPWCFQTWSQLLYFQLHDSLLSEHSCIIKR